VLRSPNPQTLSADLLDAATRMGAQGVINVYLDVDPFSKKVLTASALAIKYTDTLNSETTTITKRGTSVKTRAPVMSSDADKQGDED
jgi:uncharacterized protein YbjQ (UPF0145 family)